jgi:hypothetical protein
MNTIELEQAYGAFLELAARGGFDGRRAADGGWNAELVVAHVVANDRLIAAHLAEAIAGREARYDNHPANREHYLRSIIRAAGDWDALVDAAGRSSAEVLSLVWRLDGPAAGRPLHTFILDGEVVRVDEPVPPAALLAAQWRVHLPAHSAQLAALTVPADSLRSRAS